MAVKCTEPVLSKEALTLLTADPFTKKTKQCTVYALFCISSPDRL